MASLWYTHSPQFVAELQSCATEFKQYMANLARSIRSAATDMALGLVHARYDKYILFYTRLIDLCLGLHHQYMVQLYHFLILPHLDEEDVAAQWNRVFLDIPLLEIRYHKHHTVQKKIQNI